MFGKLAPFFKLNQQWYDLILGGSIALILQDALPYRQVSDIDLVGHRYNIWNNQVINHIGTSVDDADCLTITIDNVKYDYFIKPTVIWSEIELMGVKIKVQSPKQIISAKMLYYLKYDIVKHRDDIIAFFDIKKNGYKEQETGVLGTLANTTEDDLPF